MYFRSSPHAAGLNIDVIIYHFSFEGDEGASCRLSAACLSKCLPRLAIELYCLNNAWRSLYRCKDDTKILLGALRDEFTAP